MFKILQNIADFAVKFKVIKSRNKSASAFIWNLEFQKLEFNLSIYNISLQSDSEFPFQFDLKPIRF